MKVATSLVDNLNRMLLHVFEKIKYAHIIKDHGYADLVNKSVYPIQTFQELLVYLKSEQSKGKSQPDADLTTDATTMQTILVPAQPLYLSTLSTLQKMCSDLSSQSLQDTKYSTILQDTSTDAFQKYLAVKTQMELDGI